MIKNLLLVKKMVIKSNKKNPIIKDLYTKKYKPKVVKPKKGKGSFKRKKILECCNDKEFIISKKNGYQLK